MTKEEFAESPHEAYSESPRYLLPSADLYSYEMVAEWKNSTDIERAVLVNTISSSGEKLLNDMGMGYSDEEDNKIRDPLNKNLYDLASEVINSWPQLTANATTADKTKTEGKRVKLYHAFIDDVIKIIENIKKEVTDILDKEKKKYKYDQADKYIKQLEALKLSKPAQEVADKEAT